MPFFRKYGLQILLLTTIVLQLASIFTNKNPEKTNEQVATECEKIREISYREQTKSGISSPEEPKQADPKTMLMRAAEVEKKAADMEALDIKDERLKRYKFRYVKLYKQESQAFRDWAKLVPDPKPSDNQSKNSPAGASTLERQLQESLEKQRRVEESLEKLAVIDDTLEQYLFLIDGLAGYCDQ